MGRQQSQGLLTALTMEGRAGAGGWGPTHWHVSGAQLCQAGPCACPELRSARNASRPLGKHLPHPPSSQAPCLPSMAWPGVTREPWGWRQCPH